MKTCKQRLTVFENFLGKTPFLQILHRWHSESCSSLVVQWLRLCTSSEGGSGSIPGWRTRILHAKKKKKANKHIHKPQTKNEPNPTCCSSSPQIPSIKAQLGANSFYLSCTFSSWWVMRGISFSSKGQVAFNFITAVTTCSDFGAPKMPLLMILIMNSAYFQRSLWEKCGK